MDDKKAISVQIENSRDAISVREQFLMDYLTCCLCGAELMFTHVTDFVESEVTEEATCQCCKIRQATKSHRLQ
jgi:hypothetical protein